MTAFLRKIQFSVSNILIYIYFERKAKRTEYRFTFNSYNPFRKNKTVSFADYKRIKDLNLLEEEKLCCNGFELKKIDYILIYRTVFDSETHFPSIKECIHINWNLRVELQCDGNPIPLPQLFIHGHNAKLIRFSMLENFPNYTQNVVKEHPYSILKDLQRQLYI